MPCSDNYSYQDEVIYETRQEISFLKAALCFMISNFGIPDASFTNKYDEAGITHKQLNLWAKKHQREDAERRAREQKKREENEAKKKALAKLSKKERNLLGISSRDDWDTTEDED